MKSSVRLKLKPKNPIPTLKSFFNEKFVNQSIFLETFKEFEINNPNKIDIKAEETSKLLKDKNLLIITAKKTKLDTKKKPKKF